MLILDLLSRWAHVGAAVVLIGGAVFTRFVLMPAAVELPDDQHQALKERLRVRWAKFVHIGIMLLLISGFYNFFTQMGAHKGQPLYHALVGVKMLLAFGAFYLASVLSGRSPKSAHFRENSRKWLGVLIALRALIAGLGSVLKVAVPAQAPASAAN